MDDISGLLAQARTALIRGDQAQALSILAGISADDLSCAEVWFLRGAAHHGLGNLGLARDNLQMSADLDRNHQQSRFALAAVYLDLDDAAAAQFVCREVLSVAPDSAQAWFSLGVAQERGADIEASLSSYGQVLLLDCKHEGALKNRLGLLRKLGRFSESVESANAYVAAYPFSAAAQFALGEACLSACENIKAAAAFGRAEKLSPQNARAKLHAGFALAMCERFAEAQKFLDQAYSLDPELLVSYRASIFNERRASSVLGLDARSLFLLRHYDRIECCDWRDRAYFVRRFADLIAEGCDGKCLNERALGFRAMAMGIDIRLQRLLATKLALSLNDGGASVRLRCRTDSDRRLRIGYVSPDFRMHPIGLMTAKLYDWHDRARFEIYCYALGGDDGSDIHQNIRSECDHFICLNDMDDAQAAQKIADDAIDILVDLAGFTEDSRPGILGLRPAPIQISWLGYAATMGAPWIDYLVADDVCIPREHEEHYSESIIRMPAGQYLCSYAADPVMEAPSKIEAGLPTDGMVLAAMHNLYKIDPEIFAIWMRILARHHGSILWLIDANDDAVRNLRLAASSAGINPCRLLFAPKIPHAAHLARLQLADIVLDTPQCNGSTTICDALAAGVPVVTCKGVTFAQRMAASVLVAAELDDWATSTLEEYERTVNALLCSPTAGIAARQRIVNARSSALFFRPRDWVRYLESGYETAWRQYCDGSAPGSIEVRV